jgi:hypothetical protein
MAVCDRRLENPKRTVVADRHYRPSDFALVSQSLTAPSRLIGTDKLKDQSMKLHFVRLALASSFVVPTIQAAGFADAVLAYDPGVGFASGYTNTSVVLGPPVSTVNPFTPPFRNTQLLSLGTGGYVTIQFFTLISNDPSHPFGLDFLIFGNSGFIITNGNFSGGGITAGAIFGNNSGATRVSVSQDNVTYYQLNPLLTPVVDGLFPTAGPGDFSRPVDPSLASSDFAAKDLTGIRSLYGGSGGGSGFDIAWAQDENGQSVSLSDISYVRVDVLSGKSEIDSFSVVPEPTPWALTCLGVALVGCAKRRRLVAVKRITSGILMGLVITSLAGAASYQEDFSSDPLAKGWQVFGQTNLFHWNATNQNLEVIWDSSKSNSYFHRTLGTTLSKVDDFSVSFNLRLADIAVGVNTNKSDTFQIALGFINLTAATRAGFLRGTGTDSPNLVEFDYFPDAGFSATVAPTIISSNNVFNVGGFTFPLELKPGDLYHVAMSYTASNKTLRAIMTRDGAPFGPIHDATFGTNFTDFCVDSIAVCSYSDVGFAGSVLAHGVLDDLRINVPEPPVTKVAGGFENGAWRVELSSRTNWLYTLQRTSDWVSWTNVSPVTAGTGSLLMLQETNSASASSVFYRVKAEKP